MILALEIVGAVFVAYIVLFVAVAILMRRYKIGGGRTND
jgi:hypothetical protein